MRTLTMKEAALITGGVSIGVMHAVGSVMNREHPLLGAGDARHAAALEQRADGSDLPELPGPHPNAPCGENHICRFVQ